jgi:hypothetical protein
MAVLRTRPVGLRHVVHIHRLHNGRGFRLQQPGEQVAGRTELERPLAARHVRLALGSGKAGYDHSADVAFVAFRERHRRLLNLPGVAALLAATAQQQQSQKAGQR